LLFSNQQFPNVLRHSLHQPSRLSVVK
jgi:hypothetical protein